MQASGEAIPRHFQSNAVRGAHGRRINSSVLVYIRPHIIQGGLAGREKQTPGYFVPPAVMAGSAVAPDKGSATVTLYSCRNQLMGTGTESLVQ